MTHPENVIRQAIDEKGFRYGFVAEKLGIPATHLSKSLSGKRKLRPNEFITLCNLLDLNISDFTKAS